MIQQSLLIGGLPLGVNKDLIPLIYKGGATYELTNYRPITLLNVSYKILVKALQPRLQSFLPIIIDEDQIGFLPIRYILDNVLVQTEIIEWSKELEQDLILLKLDFKKAYDTEFYLASRLQTNWSKTYGCWFSIQRLQLA